MTYVDALGISKTDSKGLSILNIHGFPTAPAGNSAAGWADLRKRLKDVSVPLWMTETSGEEAMWLGEGKGGEGALFMAQKIHEALAIGECEAWVYWAIADPAPSEFALMALSAPTPKYAAAKQYFRYIRPGAQRVTVTPASTTILVSAYQHAEQKTITVVLINKNATKSEVKLSIRGMPAGITSFEAVRSSATESTAALAAVPVVGSSVSLTLPAQSVTTLFATYP